MIRYLHLPLLGVLAGSVSLDSGAAHPHPRSHLGLACDAAAELAANEWSSNETMVPLATLLEAIAEHCGGDDDEGSR